MERMASDNNICGVVMEYSKERFKSIVRGRNILLSEGFAPCPNKYYLVSEKEYAHFNTSCGRWVFEKRTDIYTNN